MVVRAKRIELTPKGIRNIGNTCFFNSSIQCLLSIPEFVTFYIENNFDYTKPISGAFAEFLADYKKLEIVTPNKFLNFLNSKINLFDGSQQDAHEFVIRFLEVLHDELPNKFKKLQSKEEFIAHCSENIIAKLFYSFNKQTIFCSKCGNKSESFVLLNMMQIQVEKTTQEGLSRIFENEKIDGLDVWKCENCGHSKVAFKQLEVIIYPKILILYISRFNSMAYKNRDSIKIDEKIKLGNNIYFFNGLVCHSGNLNEGHYYSSAKRGDKWINFNDTSIYHGGGSYSDDSPYMVFYSKTI